MHRQEPQPYRCGHRPEYEGSILKIICSGGQTCAISKQKDLEAFRGTNFREFGILQYSAVQRSDCNRQ